MEVGIVTSHGLWKLRSRSCSQGDPPKGGRPDRKLSVTSGISRTTSGTGETDIEKQVEGELT
jgi:hypothetical protein